MSITNNVSKIKPTDFRTFVRRNDNEEEIAKMDIVTYNISRLNIPHMTLNYSKEVFLLLFPQIADHIAKPQYWNKKVYFDIYFENNNIPNRISSNVEISFVWNGEPNIQNIVSYIYNKIADMKETYLPEPIEFLDMVVISKEEKFLQCFLEEKFPTRNTNENKTFQS